MADAFLYRFVWDPAKAETNWQRHGVTFDEAASVFRDPLALTIFDADHSEQEERWITLGRSACCSSCIPSSRSPSTKPRSVSSPPAKPHPTNAANTKAS